MKKLFVATLTLFCASVILFNLSISFAAGNGRPLRGDFTGDGRVTSDDAVYLLRYVLFPNDYPICDHAYGTYWVTVKEPTEALTGMKKQYCEECGAILGEEEIPCIEPSKLEYQINEDGKTCTITGPGDFEGDTLIIPDTINGYIVSRVGSWAFTDMTEIKSVIISDNVIEICERAFSGCTALENIKIGEKVTSIGNYTFANCNSIITVVLPDSIEHIGDYAFYRCKNLNRLYIGTNVTTVGYYAFDCGGNHKDIYIKDINSWCNIKFNGFFQYSSAFPLYNADLYINDILVSNLIIPDDVYTIHAGSFAYCAQFTSITFGTEISVIEPYAFANCISLTSVTLPPKVTNIGQNVFKNCKSLKRVNIHDSVTMIDDYALQGCTALESITIPSSVSIIGNNAFGGCTGLTSINYTSTKSNWGKILKYNGWNNNTGAYNVHCTDGDLRKENS